MLNACNNAVLTSLYYHNHVLEAEVTRGMRFCARCSDGGIIGLRHETSDILLSRALFAKAYATPSPFTNSARERIVFGIL